MTNSELKEKATPLILRRARELGQCDGRIDTWCLADYGKSPIPEPVIATILRDSGEFKEVDDILSLQSPVPRTYFKLK